MEENNKNRKFKFSNCVLLCNLCAVSFLGLLELWWYYPIDSIFLRIIGELFTLPSFFVIVGSFIYAIYVWITKKAKLKISLLIIFFSLGGMVLIVRMFGYFQ